MTLYKRLYRAIEAGDRWVLNALEPRAFPARGLKLPPIFIVALPKTGSVYIQRALRSTLQIQRGEIRLGGIVDITFDWNSLVRFSRGNALTRVHLPPRSHLLYALRQAGVAKIVLHLRDPRSQIISWTRHVDRSIAQRGLASGMLDCQQVLPSDYASWSFESRLKWQVDNQLEGFVKWTENWLDLSQLQQGPETLVTSYEDFSRSPADYVRKVCSFYNIPLGQGWLRLPAMAIGSNNIFHKEAKSPVEIMGPDLYEQASAAIPATLAQRFGWLTSASVKLDMQAP
ncbi:MAG: hypothetical protein E6Q98_02900 [Rhodospirillaceae bacterium]|nr:MAG: hypothetical protein E6Q98_02900 [Rhodospirillaceae bacterium]